MPYDRHESLSGVSGANPLLVPRNLAAGAINRRFRYDENRPRLPIQNLELRFASEEERIWFEGGNFQGAFFYNSYPSFLRSCLIASIAGRIFRIEISGKIGIVTTLFKGNDPVLTHAWFAQGFQWLVIQDGLNKPILWNGTDEPRRAIDGEVPVGSVMAFIHGRLVVSSADGTNQIAVGDIVYGEDQTTTNDVIKFTETGYWAEGGAFGVPVFVGDINGMQPMPYLDTGTGQNELVILGTEGAVSLDLSRPRAQWLDTQLLRISLIGGGCVSTHSLCTLNGDLFYRSAEGIRSYRNARAEFTQSWKQSPISSDVRRWIDTDSPRLLQYNSQASWNNMLLSTCSPILEGPNNRYAGFHRYHRGFVVMDAQAESTTLRTGSPVWQGVWTGIRVTQFVEGRIDDSHRCFAFSYDRDGRNRLYEIYKDGRDTFSGTRRKLVSSYDTSAFGTIERTTSNFELKQVKGGELELKEINEAVEVTLAVKPDNSPCFFEHYNTTLNCDCPDKGCIPFTQPAQARITFGGLEAGCDPSTEVPISRAHHWQARVRMTGNVTVQGLAYRFEVDKNPVSCGTVGGQCTPIQCDSERDTFTYHIAPEGENNESPNIPRPSDLPPDTFSSIQSYTAKCAPPLEGIAVTESASATSTISQSDADVKAIVAAKEAAQSKLQCFGCLPTVAVQVEAPIGYTSFAYLFVEGAYPEYAGRTFRLIDEHTLAIYASGSINAAGTFILSYSNETSGDVLFYSGTNILENSSLAVAFVQVQISCTGPEGISWPTLPNY